MLITDEESIKNILAANPEMGLDAAKLKLENINLGMTNATLLGEITQNHAKIELLQAENAALRQQVDTWKEMHAIADRAAIKFQTANTDLKKQVEELQEESRIKALRISRDGVVINRLHDQIDEFRAEFHKEFTALEGQNEKLRKTLSNAQEALLAVSPDFAMIDEVTEALKSSPPPDRVGKLERVAEEVDAYLNGNRAGTFYLSQALAALKEEHGKD